MKFLVLMSTLTSLMIPAPISFAIQFDIWETGMSIQEVVGLARKHDLPIAREGLIPGSKKFDPKLINEESYKSSAVMISSKQVAHHRGTPACA